MKEVAYYVGISEQAVWHASKKGRLHRSNPGSGRGALFELDEVERFKTVRAQGLNALSTKEVAHYLGLSHVAVWQALKSGRLHRCNAEGERALFKLDEVERFKAAREQTKKGQKAQRVERSLRLRPLVEAREQLELARHLVHRLEQLLSRFQPNERESGESLSMNQ
jgi:excisionase family DNA binding protein